MSTAQSIRRCTWSFTRRAVAVLGAALITQGLAACEAGDVGQNSGGYSAATAPLTVGGHHCPTSGEIAGRDIPSDGLFYLTTFGGGSDTQTMACGRPADGTWYYVADKWRYSCGARIRMTNPATGASCVAEVADVGPNICVEQAAGRPIIDASPLVALGLFHVHSAGWSDRREISVEQVDASTPLGCEASSGSGTGTGSCSSGQTRCGTSCVDLQSSSANCGSCGNACGASETCESGTCVASSGSGSTGSCSSGQTDCGSGCVDLQSDTSNCGSCGTACGGSETCESGTCVASGSSGSTGSCSSGQTDCGAGCTDTQTDTSNCGSCGNACGASETCESGTCVSGSSGSGGSSSCDWGLDVCDGLCVDLQTDSVNCGACGVACDFWTESCVAGSCQSY